MLSSRTLLVATACLTAAGLFFLAVVVLHGSSGDLFMPQAHCYLFNRKLMALHGISDLLIGLSYVAISGTLTYLVLRARRQLPFHWMMLAFAFFIVAGGATHFMEVWTLQAVAPRYWLSGWVKVLTAVASLTTAIALPALVPKIRAVLESARLAGERKAQLESAYAELEALYRKVTHLSKQKANFFTNISHELRTPLSLIFAPVERVLQSPDLDDENRRDLLLVRRNALMLHNDVNDLLDASRLESGIMEPHYSRIDLVSLVRFVAGAFDSVLAGRGIEITFDTPGELITEIDSDKIQRVLLNLLSNALKFAPEKGRLAISLRTEGDSVVMLVEDNGPGIPVEMRETVFERFHRGDAELQRRFGGTGLGLSIVKEFVELHGGSVTAGESALGGAKFAVRLPLRAPAGTVVAEASWHSHDPLLRRASDLAKRDGEETRWAREQSEAQPDPAAVAAGAEEKPLILVAEDNRDMNDFICRVLGPEMRTIAAHTGRAALELARSRRPDLILTDMMMPEMSGDDLIRAVRQEPSLAEVPIVLLTAKTDDEEKLTLLAGGAQDYVVKPFSIDELRARVRNQVVAKITRDTLRRELDSQSQDLAQLARELSQRARELEGAKNEAESANRAKDQFLAVLSHELRTPLTPALAAAANLEQAETVPPEELRESLALIRRNIELEARLVDDLLDLTRITKGKLQIQLSTINLHETIRHATEMCRSEANNKGCELRLALEAADHHVLGDGARLAQVFWNLLLNAVKFTPAQGCIGLHTSNPTPGAVRIEVSDTGIGIDDAMLARIFEPFQQGEPSTTRRYGGLGLGLSVAKGLVDAHSGTIAARSDGKDRGATFSIELPTTVPPAAPRVTGAPAASAQQRSLRILLVEDHVDTRRALERLLTRWRHTVIGAATVAQAVELAPAFQPDLILSDVGLPDGTGMELLGKLRAAGVESLAVAMSGYGMESDLQQTRDAGFVEHLVKPVAAERLREVIERLTAQ